MFLLVEEAVLKKMIEFIGWKEGDGIFNPGEYDRLLPSLPLQILIVC